jgi:hypothetical protein
MDDYLIVQNFSNSDQLQYISYKVGLYYQTFCDHSQ